MRTTKVSTTKVRRTDHDPADLPIYALVDAARYLKIAPATLRSWVRGRTYPRQRDVGVFQPLIVLPDPGSSFLSFPNLVEAHVLRALRTEHGLSIRDVRAALEFSREQLGIERLLLSTGLRTHARDVFLDRYGELVNLSRSGQLAMRQVLSDHLGRIVWGEGERPLKLYPFLRADHASRIVAIDPRIAFGRPIIESRGVSTEAIVARIDAGESQDEVAEDYGLEPAELTGALVFERAA